MGRKTKVPKKGEEVYGQFKKDFWPWFDALPLRRKRAFWYYKDDMSECFYFHAVYAKKDLNSK